MLKLTAKKHDKLIMISIDEFEHLLNCLDNQKHLTDLAEDQELEYWHIPNIQTPIDDFRRQCSNLLLRKDDIPK